MKKLILLLSCVFLAACTNSDLKKKALAAAESQYAMTLEKELEGLTMPGRLRENYLSYLQKTSSFAVHEVKIIEQNAVVSVQQEAVAIENRKTLAQIASRVETSKAGQFNMGNAINLIEQQAGQVKGKKETLYFFKFHKAGSDWVLDEAP